MTNASLASPATATATATFIHTLISELENGGGGIRPRRIRPFNKCRLYARNTRIVDCWPGAPPLDRNKRKTFSLLCDCVVRVRPLPLECEYDAHVEASPPPSSSWRNDWSKQASSSSSALQPANQAFLRVPPTLIRSQNTLHAMPLEHLRGGATNVLASLGSRHASSRQR